MQYLATYYTKFVDLFSYASHSINIFLVHSLSQHFFFFSFKFFKFVSMFHKNKLKSCSPIKPLVNLKWDANS